MPYGLYLSADGVNVQSKRLEILANNLANVDTNGFKRELAVFQARLSEANAQGLDQPGARTINDLSGGVRFLQTMTDFSTGALADTGVPTDMAILGDGFFLVDRAGEKLLTRAGNFSFTATGTLVTEQGYPVLDIGGAPMQVAVDAGPVEVAPDGSVYQFDLAGVREPVGAVAIVQPPALGDLVKQGENLFKSSTPVAAIPPEGRRVRSGFLEKSGVRATSEMMELIETTRALEANVNMIRNQDQVLGTLVGRAMRI
jgi:flagellar basal-body rod protein FlgF/flagellar basal-body rod protein FlgG